LLLSSLYAGLLIPRPVLFLVKGFELIAKVLLLVFGLQLMVQFPGSQFSLQELKFAM